MKLKLPRFSRCLIALMILSVLMVSDAFAVTLDECIAATLKNNPDVRAATERVQVARAAIKEYHPEESEGH